MPGRFKIHTLGVCALVGLLFLFFQFSKHQPALAMVNPFAEDPYDAVGSFGVQCAPLIALLSCLRAFRPYKSGKASEIQEILLRRSNALACISVAVVLATDVVAMVRYPAQWISSSAGYVLAGLLGGMILCTVLIACFVPGSSQRVPQMPGKRKVWVQVSSILGICILVLALYPQSWRQSLPGALATALVGMASFFIAVRACETALLPALPAFFEDSLDDIASIYRWLIMLIGFPGVLLAPLVKALRWPLARWLNPRTHAWVVALLVGVLMGLALAYAEVTGEGGGGAHLTSASLTILAIFVGLESAGVLLGYVLLARPLGLFRHAS